MPYVAPPTPANPQPAPISRYSARSSYFGASGHSPSEGLQRARKPFRAKNALTGLLIMGFVGSVYGYSISAVKQDDFSDLPSASTAASGDGVKTIEEELAEKVKAGGSTRGIGAMMGMGSSPQGEGVRQESFDPQPSPSERRFATPQQSTLSTPLPPGSNLAPTPPVPATTTLASPSLAGPRPSSRWIVGAPDVDRLGKLNERSAQDGLVDQKRLV